ncbi:hypothetical protein O181_115691 [Austropuccinia psidii MF-1]|uniref:Uncharacterized protein n=1 Tax=Austropuccinia psidii MF-1 TaxID=1389203 RepID=A0A9Q3PWE4_9BASI|nr:hypothetical protein [Austropuccinia psidii MF-1]
MSSSPARGNKEPPPILKKLLKDAHNARHQIEDTSSNDFDMEIDEVTHYSKRFMDMMEYMTKRLNAMEEKQRTNSKQNEKITTPNANDVIRRLIIENEELPRRVKELEKIIKENQKTKETKTKTPTFAKKATNNITF